MMSEEDEYSDAELEEIRRRRYSDLQRAAMEEQRQSETRRQFESQKQAALKQILTPEARQRLTNIRMVKPEFADQIELAGYQLDRRAAQPGQTINLTLYWRARKPISKNYSVFTHIRGEGQSLWAQKDSWPQNGAAPTATWQAGRLVEDTYGLTLKPDTPAGVYDIEIGLYDAAGQRLQLVTPDGRLADNFAYLAKVRVAGP